MSSQHTIFADLRRDHDQIKMILADLCNTEEKDASRITLLNELKSILEPHSRAEEKVFYDYLRNHAKYDDQEVLANEGYVEHNVVDNLIAQMENADTSTKEWTAQAKVLKELLENHIEEEEGDMFKEAKPLIPKEIAYDLAEEFEELKHEVEETLH